MNLIKVTKKVVTSALLLVMLGGAGAVMNGCAYGGVATTPDGTVVITRNDLLLFGLLRKVYTCKNNGGQLTCVETPPRSPSRDSRMQSRQEAQMMRNCIKARWGLALTGAVLCAGSDLGGCRSEQTESRQPAISDAARGIAEPSRPAPPTD